MRALVPAAAICVGAICVALMLGGTPRANPPSKSLCRRADRSFLVVRAACREIPELSRPGLSDTRATTLLRHWAAGWIDIAASRSVVIEDSYWKEGIDTLFRRFKGNDRGVFCAGTAWTLMRLYDAFGFDAWIYDFGTTDGSLTHTVTLVRADGKLIAQDAYVDDVIVNRSGRPMDVRAILRTLRARHEQMIGTSSGYATKDVLMTPNRLEQIRARGVKDWPWGDVRNLEKCSAVRRGVVLCRVPRVSFARLRSWSAWPRVGAFLHREHLPSDFLYLMTQPIGMSSADDGWTPPTSTTPTKTRALLHTLLAAIG